MTLYMAWGASRNMEATTTTTDPPYQEKIFTGAGGVPIFGLVAIPDHPHSTLVGTYGITGTVENQWYLRLLGRKAFAQGYAVVLFDWRGHGKTADLSPTLTSDGLYEGKDFIHIASQAKAMGCPSPFWFIGYSLGGQLALWAVKAAQTLSSWAPKIGLQESEIAGGAVICPNLESSRSSAYLVQSRLGRYVEKAIAQTLKQLVWRIHQNYPEAIDPKAVERFNSIWQFDQELIIKTLGFSSVEEYYRVTSPLYFLPQLQKPTLILYAKDDPLFDPTLVSDLQQACEKNPALDLMLTAHGGHVGYLSNSTCQQEWQDSDCWWAWNRVLEWCREQSEPKS